MYQKIYRDLNLDMTAVYQIKFKGLLSSSLIDLKKNFQVTIETADLTYPVTMITGEISSQQELIILMNKLFQHGHAIISLVCVEVIVDHDQTASV